MTRREFFGMAGAAALARAQSPKPNIVFILADDLGYGDLGCYGQKRIRTPHLDRLAAEGMRFTDAYAGATVCAPSRCCLMTGRHTGHATVRGNRKPEVGLKPGEVTVASLLRDAGYRTALFGKWGLGGPGVNSTPNDKGFDEFYGYLDQQHAHNAYPADLWDNRDHVMLPQNWFWQRKQFSPDLFREKALDFLNRQSAAQPFFLYYASIIPHANNELGRFQANGMESPDLGAYAKQDWPDVEKTFASAVSRLDSDVGTLLRALESKGLAQNTLVIFSSDNGPHHEGNHSDKFFESSGPLRGAKRDLYEGGVRVPALARWPGRIPPGQVSSQPWAFWDVLPTVAEIAAVPKPGFLDGRSILPILDGKQVPERTFYWEFHEGGFHQAVRRGKWKLVRQGPDFGLELFDLSKDLGEKNNVSEQNPAVAEELRKLFETERFDSPIWRKPG